MSGKLVALAHASGQLCSTRQRTQNSVGGREEMCPRPLLIVGGPKPQPRVPGGRRWHGTGNQVRLGRGPHTCPRTPVRHAPFRARGRGWRAGHLGPFGVLECPMRDTEWLELGDHIAEDRTSPPSCQTSVTWGWTARQNRVARGQLERAVGWLSVQTGPGSRLQLVKGWLSPADRHRPGRQGWLGVNAAW